MNLNQKVVKYTKEEGGRLHVPAGEGMTGREVMELPLHHHWVKGWLWGYIHSFYLEDGSRYDALNNTEEGRNWWKNEKPNEIRKTSSR